MKEDQFQKYLYGVHEYLFGQIDPNYDPQKDIHPRPIYKRHEFSEIADYLASFQKSLTEEFLKGQTLQEAIVAKGRNVLQKKSDRPAYMEHTPDADGNRFADFVTEILRTPSDKNKESTFNPNGWKNVEFKYHDPFSNIHWDIDPKFAETNFPTAYRLVKEFWDDCPIASYSCLSPQTVLHRHTGPENRNGEYVRIHIPLIVPEGDIFFEVDGEEITWSDIFAFDNQLVHSAHNLTNEFRLIFLIDISRKRLGLPPGQIFNKDRQLYGLSKPFVRKQK